MPVCPKCHQLISESHYERHLRRCGTTHEHEPQTPYARSATAHSESPDRSIGDGPADTHEGSGRNWKKWLLAGFVIALLIGSLVLIFLVYALSVL
jgi:hypothetical protein